MSTLTYEYLDAESREMIVDLMDGDSEMIIDLVDTLAETTPDLLSELESGIQNQDGLQIREAAHALKSSNAQLGALEFADLCGQMEELGKNDELATVSDLYQLIMSEYEKVNAALHSWKIAMQ